MGIEALYRQLRTSNLPIETETVSDLIRQSPLFALARSSCVGIANPLVCRPSRACAFAVAIMATASLTHKPTGAAQRLQSHESDQVGVSVPEANTLLGLAQSCAKSLTNDRNCREYNSAGQFVIVKDASKRKPVAYLIIPTVSISGIEDRQIFLPPFVDFWDYGWKAATRYVKKSPTDMALAVNSQGGRGYPQLHIHLSCVLSDVSKSLALHDGDIEYYPDGPYPLRLGPHREIYEIFKVKSLTGENSPYNVIASNPSIKDHMADQSIAVTGTAAKGVYYVLQRNGRGGRAEDLLSQDCKDKK